MLATISMTVAAIIASVLLALMLAATLIVVWIAARGVLMPPKRSDNQPALPPHRR
jgi:hypothetical protein